MTLARFFPTLRRDRQEISTHDLLDTFAVFVHIDVANGDASEDTVRGYYSQVKQYVEWCGQAGINPATATEDDIKQYRAYLIQQRYEPGTIAHKLTVVRRFYEAIKDRGYRADNPAAGVKPPRDRRAEDDIPYLSEDELRRLLDALPRDGSEKHLRDLALLAFLGLQARRQIEAHRASVEDIRPDGSMLVKGKYHDTVIQLRSDVQAIFRAYIERRGRTLYDDMGTPLFVAVGNRAGGRRMSRRGIRQVVDFYLRKAGLKRPGLSGHALRHTAATLAYAGTKDLRAIQELLGHQDPKTTSKYAHIVNRREDNPAEAIAITL